MAHGVEGAEHGGDQRDGEWKDAGLSPPRHDPHQCAGTLTSHGIGVTRFLLFFFFAGLNRQKSNHPFIAL